MIKILLGTYLQRGIAITGGQVRVFFGKGSMFREIFYGYKGGLAVALLLQDSKTALISKALLELNCIDKLLKGFLLLGKDKIFLMLIDIFRGKLMTKDSEK